MYTSEGLVVAGILIIAAILIGILFSIPTIIGMWKIFTKAGLSGWECLIPFYGSYQLGTKVLATEKAGLIFLGLDIAISLILNISTGYVAIILIYGINLYKNIKIANSFGQNIGFAIGMTLLPFVFYPILGFGKDAYIGPVSPK